MPRTSFEMVKEFHEALDHPVGNLPMPIADDRLLLRLRLIMEETAELVCAMTGQPPDIEASVKQALLGGAMELYEHRMTPDMVGVADGACDVHVVVSGTCVEFGIPEDLVYEEVHRANMAKAGGGKDDFGKSIKPEGWTPPDVAGVLKRYRHAGMATGGTV
jgi:predicted HAD superfamily Cof-like phosphohydrolase